MNDREFRQHLVKLRLERERKEAQAETRSRNPMLLRKPRRQRRSAPPRRRNPEHGEPKWTSDDSWPKVWAESDEELRDRLRHYLFLAANGPNPHATRIGQLVVEADKRGKAEMVDDWMQWVKSHEPSKQE